VQELGAWTEEGEGIRHTHCTRKGSFGLEQEIFCGYCSARDTAAVCFGDS
jgi:hypothetical protein